MIYLLIGFFGTLIPLLLVLQHIESKRAADTFRAWEKVHEKKLRELYFLYPPSSQKEPFH